jgi:hypothetical protein
MTIYDGYRVASIRHDQVDKGFVLMRLIAPSLSLDKWRFLCASTKLRGKNADPQTIVVATNSSGYIQGLYVASIRESYLHGRFVEAPAFVVTSAADERGVSAALLAHLRSFAQNCACREIHVWTLGHDNWSRMSNRYDALADRPGLVIVVEPAAPKQRN